MGQVICVADPHPDFAGVLRDTLEQHGYTVHIAHSPEDLTALLAQTACDLLILDAALSSNDPAELILQIRSNHPTLRIVWVPPFGSDPEEEVLETFALQGLLPKPFFPHQIVTQVEAALQASLATDAPTWAPETIEQITHILDELVHELAADAALLIDHGHLVAYTGTLPPDRASELASLVHESLQISNRIASFLGESESFELNSFEGEAHHLYTTVVTNAMALAVSLQSPTPAGMIRLHIRRAVKAIHPLLP